MFLFFAFVLAVSSVTSSPDTISSSSSSASSSSSTSSSSSSASSSSVITTDGGCGPKCPKRCRPTCEVPNPKNCNTKGRCSYCGSGKVWNEDEDKCVQINECPYGIGCNGDPNAGIREMPPPCPSTCDTPDEFPCKKMGLAVGCTCNQGYILSENDGICIKPDTCPGGNPCGANGTFVSCKNPMACPSSFCPIEDGTGIVICDLPLSCPSGCVCKHLHVWKSQEDRTCILSQECPELPCPRPNEIWNRCPSPCFSDGCENFNKQQVCNTLIIPQCYPQCRCKEGYARNYDTYTCIPGEECLEKPPYPILPEA